MSGIQRKFPIENPYGPYRPPNQCPPGQGGYSKISDTQIGLFELGKTIQLYGRRPSAVAVGTTTYISDSTMRISMTQGLVDTTSERLWAVQVNGIEIITYSPQDNPIVRLPKDRILSLADTPPGHLRYSTLQAEVRWMDGSAKSCVKLIDIAGGTNFEVLGRNVQIDILAPADTQIIENGSAEGSAVDALSGLVFNGLYSARVAPADFGATCLDTPKFTKWTQIPANQINFVEIPPGAKKVRVYNSRLSAADTTELDFWISNDPVNGYSVGTIDFVNTNSTDLFDIPCGATYISTTPIVNALRYLTFVFIVDP